ncbi:hypothetical protein GOB15_23780 [Sinorhizobium meliloti]|nr:hypothetical protein [Sinorhizobium meliloti]MDW9512859.1 hypothetical protein [Sinorhizobium meliloti]
MTHHNTGAGSSATVPAIIISRRAVLTGAFALATKAAGSNDPLLETIMAFRAGTLAYSAVDEREWPLYGGEQAVIAKTYGPPLNALEEWDRPAETRQGALEALRFAHEESLAFQSAPTVAAMVAAALAYFEREEA